MSTLTTKDGTQLYYKDWGSGQPVVFSHGWPLNSNSGEGQMLFLAPHGYRCIAHDRRGHGRSSQSWDGNEMNTYADDLAAVIDSLNLQDAILVGFSTGGGEVARYIALHGAARVAKAALISSVPPLMLKTASNQGGLAMTLGYTSMDKVLIRKDRAATTRRLCGGPTGLPANIASLTLPSRPEGQAKS